MQTNSFLAFLSELVSRLQGKTPKFFVVWQWISAIVAGLTGVPEFLRELNIVLPAPFSFFENKIVAIASVVAFMMAKLPVQNPVVNRDATGAPLTKTDPQKTPFTANDQLKKNGL